MGHCTCCVVNCKNNGKNSKCVFYTFPQSKSRIDQRTKWITAVKRINSDGSPWQPKPSDVICSAHFIGNQKSNDLLNPSYVPTIFPSVYKTKSVNSASKISRHARFMERRKKREFCTQATVTTGECTRSIEAEMEQIQDQLLEHVQDHLSEQISEPSNCPVLSESVKCDNECQADIIFDYTDVPQRTFICNRYIYNNSSYSDVEIQTENLVATSRIIVPNQEKYKDKGCGTPQKTYVDQSLGPIIIDKTVPTFSGFSSVKHEQQLLDIAGVTFDNFNFLLKLYKSSNDVFKISKEDKLLIFLMKIKTGLTFSAISVLFSVHRVTISRIFFSILQELYSASASLVFWPEKHVVKATVPQCFYPDYVDTRVIIDCTEFRIEVPKSVDDRVYTYSHYKKGFTAKVLIGITPVGFISFKSKVAGGRKSDSQLTIESGLIDLLEEGDKVLADKGFPEIRRTMDETGKNITIIMPPFLEKKDQFNQQETEATYNIAKVRIHVERIMQRLRTYQILNKIPASLFHYIDAILHICCVLVNLQPPIISDNTDENTD